MGDKIVFAVGNKIGLLNESSVSYLTSQYLNNYKKNHEEIQKKYEWKTQGVNAAFRGDNHALEYKDVNQIIERASINGITFVKDGDQIVYTVSVDDFSGIFMKSVINNNELESHIIHDNRSEFFNLDYNSDNNKIALSVQNSGLQRNIALLNLGMSRYDIITEGDSIDDNPSWSKTNQNHIYYDSAGIGRDHAGNIEFGPKSIMLLDINTGELEEIVASEKYDYYLPKADKEGNVYFIRKPFSIKEKPKGSIKDTLLIPVKISRAIYNWVELFTMRYSGETFKKRGPNPAKSGPDEKQVFINGNLINADKALKENQKRGEKFPGIAPGDWELIKLDNTGRTHTFKRGVIDYDLTNEGDIIYSNGNNLIKLSIGGQEEIINKVELAKVIKVI